MNRHFVRQIVARLTRAAALASAALALAQCSPLGAKYADGVGARYADDDEQVAEITASTGRFTVGKPYTVRGRTYVPAEDPSYRAEGIASWYGPDFHGGLTANGERYDMNGISAAHPTMPLPSYARVTNLSNGRSLIVRVNDRGPYHSDRIMDLSVRSAQLLGFHGRGTAWVRVEYAGRAPMEGSDDRILEASLRHDHPASANGLVRTAAQIRPVPLPPVSPPAQITRTASISAADAEPSAVRRVAVRTGIDGTAQFLNGRGLY